VDLALRPEAFGGDGAGAGAEEEEVTVRASLDLPARGDRPVGGLLDFRSVPAGRGVRAVHGIGMSVLDR